MIEIDGSMGEGGGQVLRSSLTLAVLIGKPVHLVNMRAGRPKPGLQPQHLMSVKTAAAICSAEVEGAVFHSQELTFRPGPVQPGDYRFDVGTAGWGSGPSRWPTSCCCRWLAPKVSPASGPRRLPSTCGPMPRWRPNRLE